jgi:NAD(P)-dependent dehydrogenase (short-subunit alcohol dehydrogenase family)
VVEIGLIVRMELRHRGGHDGLQEGQKDSVEEIFSKTNTSLKSKQQNSVLSNLITFLSLASAYILRPKVFFQIYFTKMWPFSTPFNPDTDIPSLAGKVIIVTGGNAGLGKETILQLAKHNPQHIYMASRSESKALTAIAEIKSQLPKGSPTTTTISHLPLDLSSFQSIKTATQTFTSPSPRLDLLILNAGIMATPPSLSPSGHDLQLATNHLGHFLLTKLLLPTLQKTAASSSSGDVRIISLSSEANNMSPSLSTIMSTSDLPTLGPWARYGASKAANILFAAEFARRYPTLTAVSLHPGLIRTQLYEPSGSTSNFFVRQAISLLGPLVFVDVKRGAWNQLWAATATVAGQSKGVKRGDGVESRGYYTPVGRLQRGNKWVEDVAGGTAFWEWTEKELAKAGY